MESWCIFLVWLYISFQRGVLCTDYATQITTSVLSGYNTAVRPFCDGATTNVTVDIAIRQVIDLDEPNQVLRLSVWMRLNWHDCRLSWNSSANGDVTNIILPYKYIWVPDLALYDNIASEFVGLDNSRANVYSDGSVYYNFPSLLEVICPVNVQKFPFDTQRCELKFGSWSYHGRKIDLFLKNDYGDLSSVKHNVEWEIQSFGAVKNVLYYSCCPDPYPDLTYTLVMKRKPLFYVNNIFIPSTLIAALALLGFFLPVDSGEKVSLQITVMLSLSVFQLLVADRLPPDSELTPFISTYFNFSLFIVGAACILAVVVIYIHWKGNQPISQWMRILFLKYLARITFVYVPEKSLASLKIKDRAHTRKGSKITVTSAKNTDNTEKQGLAFAISNGGDMKNGDIKKTENNNEHELHDESLTREEWKIIAIIIDRLSFYIFLFMLIVGTVVIIRRMME